MGVTSLFTDVAGNIPMLGWQEFRQAVQLLIVISNVRLKKGHPHFHHGRGGRGASEKPSGSSRAPNIRENDGGVCKAHEDLYAPV